LEIIAFCEENNMHPQFRFSYPDSAPDEDYFGCFFAIVMLNTPYDLWFPEREFVKEGLAELL
jgi:hypothetical protein